MQNVAIKVTKTTQETIQEEARRCYPNEACGFIVKQGRKQKAIAVINNAPVNDILKRQTTFVINPDQYIEVEENNEIIAVWHSHVEESNKASLADIAGCNNSNLPYLITSIYKVDNGFVFSERLNVITPTNQKAELIGRPYVFGVFDCWSLVVDFLKVKCNIEISNNYPRVEEFWKNNKPFFSLHYKDESLNLVTDNSFKIGDVFMFQTDNSGEISHCGVYVGNDKFLHHAEDRLSKEDIYGGYWLKHTVLHLRHKDNE